jgi:hypothetical protein
MNHENSVRLLYNPARVPQDEFLKGFILRQQEFRRIWVDMLDSRLDAIDPHFLITGQRGMGKTSLMLKVAYEIQLEPSLSDWLLPVLLPEEMYGVPDLLSFWLMVGNALESIGLEIFSGLGAELEDLAAQDDEQMIMEAIIARLRTPARKIVVFIDNFGDMLDRLSEKEVHRLREICSTAKWLRIVAASARVLEHTYSYDKPFFDFFHPIALRGLTQEDARLFLEGMAALEPDERREEILETIKNRPDRLETVRRLSGGVPRLLALLYTFVSRDPESSVLADLEGVLDQVTAYYKHRVEELPKQQQVLLHHVAMAWDAVGTGEIAKAARMESRVVSANLRHLVSNNILEQVDTGGKNHLYRLQERFLNIWYLMRMAGTKDASRMKWLVAFLETWLEGPQLRYQMENYANALKSSGLNEDADALEEALRDEINRQFEQKFAREKLNKWSAEDSARLTYGKAETPEKEPYSTVFNHQQKVVDLSNLDTKAFNIMINDAPTWESAKWTYEEMLRKEVIPHTGTLKILINRAPDWKSAIWALEELVRLEVPLDVTTFNVVWSKAFSPVILLQFLELAKGHWDTNWKNQAATDEGLQALRLAFVMVWELEFVNANQLAIPYFQNQAPKRHHFLYQEFYLITLLVRHQHQACLKLFENSPHQLKDAFKPIWYALNKLLGDVGRLELLRMGSELKETVDEIVDFILRMREKYPS